MRSSSVLALALSVLGVAGAAVGSQQAQPACVTKCWANSQYVSNCAGNKKCLCDDADFQNAMYQCLYSQCQTAQFGLALHHALALCSDDSPASTSTVPALLRQGGDLRKRGYNTQSQSNSVGYTRSSRTMTVETITFTATDVVSQPVVTYTSVTTSASSVLSYTTVSTPAVSSYTYTATFTTTYEPLTSVGSSDSYKSTPTSKTRGSQSVSASAYQTYATSRAYPKGSQVPYSVLSIAPSAVTVSNSISATSSATSSPSVVTVVVSAVPSSSSVSATATSTVTVVISQAVTATITASVVASTTSASPLEARQVWDNQRYPSDQQ